MRALKPPRSEESSACYSASPGSQNVQMVNDGKTTMMEIVLESLRVMMLERNPMMESSRVKAIVEQLNFLVPISPDQRLQGVGS